jgi:hypothetical protein
MKRAADTKLRCRRDATAGVRDSLHGLPARVSPGSSCLSQRRAGAAPSSLADPARTPPHAALLARTWLTALPPPHPLPQALMGRPEPELSGPYAKLLCLALGQLFLGRQELAEPTVEVRRIKGLSCLWSGLC